MSDTCAVCDHCSIRIRARSCQTATEEFGVACVACRQRLRADPGADIDTVSPAPIAPDDRKSYHGGGNGDGGGDATVTVSDLVEQVHGESIS